MPPSAAVEPALVLFDGHCNLCNRSVNWVIDHDPAGRFVFASLQSDAGRRALERTGLRGLPTDSVVLLEGDHAYTKSSAALRIARRLAFPWPALALLALLPQGIRDGIYDWIACHRYRWFGRTDACRTPTPELRARFAG